MTDDESTRLFIEPHRWADDSAANETITAIDSVKSGVVDVPA